MTIEPMGSIMSMQVQSTVKVKGNDGGEKRSVQTVVKETQPVVDATTIAVASAKENAKEGKTKDKNTRENDIQQRDVRIRKAVEKMNKSLGNTEALFGIHEGTNRVTIKIIDKETKEVIKELPPEKTLDMIEKVWELAGMLVDERR